MAFGGPVVIDAANSIALSNSTGVAPDKVATPGNYGNKITSIAWYVPEGINQFNNNFQAGKFIKANTSIGIFQLPLTSGGEINLVAGRPQGVFASVNTSAAPLISPLTQLHLAQVIGRDIFPRLNQFGSQFNVTQNHISGAGGSIYIIEAESPTQIAGGNPKIYNYNAFTGSGGVIMLDPPGTGPFINLGGDTEMLAIGAPIPTPPNVVPPGGQVINGVFISIGVPAFTLNAFSGSGVATDATRGVTLGLSQAAQSLLDNTYLKKIGKEDNGAYYVAGGACQPFFLDGDADTVLVGEAGTMLSPGDNRSITLKEGKVVAMVGKQSVKVDTGFGSVQIAGNSAALVQQTANGVVRVANLSGEQTTITINRNGKQQTMTAGAGEEICLCDDALSEEELIPVDGIDREALTGTITVPGVKMAKSKFDQKQMLEREKLLVCNAGSLYSMRGKIDKLKKTVEKTAKPLHPSDGAPPLKPLAPLKSMLLDLTPVRVADQPAPFEPIAFVQGTGGVSMLKTFTTATATVKHSSKCQIAFDHPTIMNLKSGEAIISSKKNTVVRTPHSLVSINPGTIAFISVVDGVTKVRNLWEMSHNSIRQNVSGKYVDIPSGHETIVGFEENSIKNVITSDGIGRRLPRHIDVPGGMKLERSEISLVTLMQQSDLLTKLVSSENSIDRGFSNKIIKMAALLTQITGKHGQYVNTQPKP